MDTPSPTVNEKFFIPMFCLLTHFHRSKDTRNCVCCFFLVLFICLFFSEASIRVEEIDTESCRTAIAKWRLVWAGKFRNADFIVEK